MVKEGIGGKALLGLAALGAAITTVVLVTRRAGAAPGVADVSGFVSDVQGLPIAGVSITLGTFETSSDGAGAYSFLDVASGSYTMTFSKAGYQTVVL